MSDESSAQGGFSLDAPQAGLSAAAFGRLQEIKDFLQKPMGVTDVTVCNWIAKGLPAERAADKSWLIDKAKGLVWVKAEIGDRGHGGDRAGSGRKTKRNAKSERQHQHAEEAQQEQGLLDAKEKAEGDEAVVFLEKFPPTHPDFITQAFKAGLGKATIERIVRLVELQQKSAELAVKSGDAVDVKTVAAEWRRRITAARAVLEAFPLRAADDVVAALGLGGESVPLAADALRAAMAKTLREIARTTVGLSTEDMPERKDAA